jgi:hypothetical protein
VGFADDRCGCSRCGCRNRLCAQIESHAVPLSAVAEIVIGNSVNRLRKPLR